MSNAMEVYRIFRSGGSAPLRGDQTMCQATTAYICRRLVHLWHLQDALRLPHLTTKGRQSDQ